MTTSHRLYPYMRFGETPLGRNWLQRGENLMLRVDTSGKWQRKNNSSRNVDAMARLAIKSTFRKRATQSPTIRA